MYGSRIMSFEKSQLIKGGFSEKMSFLLFFIYIYNNYASNTGYDVK